MGNLMSNIIVSGDREGNLKDITLEIPHDKLIVFTGLSGSGKSTLAIDVIFQECQRQYLEAMGMQGIHKPKIDSILNVSPEEAGAIDFWEQNYKEYQILSLYNASRHYKIPIEDNTAVSDFSDIQKSILFYGVESDEVKKVFPDILSPKTVVAGKFEGAFSTLWRRMSDKAGDAKQLNDYFDFDICPDCMGERLGELSRSVTVESTRLPKLVSLSLEDLYAWILKLERSLSDVYRSLVESFILDLKIKIQRIMNVGLGYLFIDRQTITLSGGEVQRVKLAATLDCDLTGIIYIMDEPTIGLHPKDTEGMIT